MEEILRLFHQYKDAVYRLALSLTGSAADAEDVTQTVFLKLMEKQPELVPGKERAWLLQVTANECRSLYRRLCRRSTVSLDEALAVAAPEYTPLLTHVMKQRPTDRAVLYLFYYEGVLHRRNRPDAAHQPERSDHPSASGQEEPEGNLGTGGIL